MQRDKFTTHSLTHSLTHAPSPLSPTPDSADLLMAHLTLDPKIGVWQPDWIVVDTTENVIEMNAM